jgi:riboflavin transporter FmnP
MKSLKSLVLAGLFLALGLLLPFLTGQIPQIGNMLLLMHIPVLLCGYFCGWQYGLAVGAVVPLLRSVLFGAPPMFPIAVAMAFELAVYGLMTGILYKRFPKKVGFIYGSLLISMVAGRVVWGAVSFLLYGLGDTAFSWEMFMGGAFLKALPGIAIQLVLIPIIVMALNKNKEKDNTLSA